jgi:hypothetical protein
LYQLLKSNFLPWFVLLGAGCFSAHAFTVADRPQIINAFENIHKEFSEKMCSHGQDRTFETLLSRWRGEGYFVPLVDSRLDTEAIRFILPQFKKREKWISSHLRFLNGIRDFNAPLVRIAGFRKDYFELLDLKKAGRKPVIPLSFESIQSQSSQKIRIFRKDFREFLTARLPFLLNYRFPVNHLLVRSNYDKLKDRVDLQIEANKSNLLRRVLQDGAQDPDRSRSDKFVRASIDTLDFELEADRDFISENTRYDLNDVLESLDIILSRGKKIQVDRLKEWLERTKKEISFYSSLLAQKKKTAEFLEKQAKARYELEEFVADQYKKVYEWWINQDELNQSLFILDSIMVNEVGDLDGHQDLERRDVSAVVLNRKAEAFYGKLNFRQKLAQRLKNTEGQIADSSVWLNLLFREGEFSFTYYYMTGAVRVFCPDMSKKGKRLRRENLKIALDALKNVDPDFKATRYFSRASMIGRIDVATLWDGYRPIAQRPGPQIAESHELRRKIQEGTYWYYDSFLSQTGETVDVVSIDDQTYCMKNEQGNQNFYFYRNPHYFTFFEKNPAL